MQDSIQKKINQMRQLSLQAEKPATEKKLEKTNSNDSLSKSIRDKKEAAIFLEELELALKIAKKNHAAF